MEKLFPHIEYLLIKNDYVIIPELGGFVLQTQSAKITEDGIIPPLTTIGFNEQMHHNDGLLALEVLRAEKISYREASIIIKNEVEKIKNNFQNSIPVKIGRLGSLFLNNDGHICFNPSTELAFLPSNLGLKKIAIQPIIKKEGKLIVDFKIKNIVRYAAVLVSLFALSFFSPEQISNERLAYAGFYFKPAPPVVPEKNILEETETMIEELPENIIYEYHIVVACLKNSVSAESYCEQLISKEYLGAQVLPSIKTNRIVIQSFTEKESAIDYLRKIRSEKKEFKDAWLHQECITFSL